MNDKPTYNNIYELLNYINANAKQEKMEKTQKINHQQLALDHVRANVYIVGSIDQNGSISFSANPMVHHNPQDARKECKRLASINTGKAFVFVRMVGAELVPTAQAVSI